VKGQMIALIRSMGSVQKNNTPFYRMMFAT